MISVKNLSHQFLIGKKGKEKIVPVLENINFDVNKGEIIAITGRSGSGKSTLLNIISGYLKATKGDIVINDANVTHLSESAWADYRLENFGFIFQSFQLIPSMTAAQNIELPLVLKGVHEKKRHQLTQEMLKKLELLDYQDHYPSELSGGQQQRVSIGRALITNPSIILADEPTGSLDSDTEQTILDLIQSLNKNDQITFVIITHDDEVAQIAHRQVKLQDGRMVGEQT